LAAQAAAWARRGVISVQLHPLVLQPAQELIALVLAGRGRVEEGADAEGTADVLGAVFFAEPDLLVDVVAFARKRPVSALGHDVESGDVQAPEALQGARDQSGASRWYAGIVQ